MNCTPCSLRLFASKSAPVISAMFPPHPATAIGPGYDNIRTMVTLRGYRAAANRAVSGSARCACVPVPEEATQIHHFPLHETTTAGMVCVKSGADQRCRQNDRWGETAMTDRTMRE